jgi:hypothetical protein
MTSRKVLKRKIMDLCPGLRDLRIQGEVLIRQEG